MSIGLVFVILVLFVAIPGSQFLSARPPSARSGDRSRRLTRMTILAVGRRSRTRGRRLVWDGDAARVPAIRRNLNRSKRR